METQFFITLLSDSSINLYPDNSLSSFRNELARPVHLQRDGWVVGLTEVSYSQGFTSQDERVYKEDDGSNKQVDVTRDFQFSYNTESVFVYCNLIQPQLVGSSYVRCLRVIQFPKPNNHHIFDKAYYVPVELNSFQTVAIELVTKLGDLARISNSVKPTTVVLHFKKVS
jgi:hypothetical protein